MKCDADGHPLPPHAKLFPHTVQSNVNWTLYKDQIQFEVTDLLFRQTKLSARSVDKILKLWDETLKAHGGGAPFKDPSELYQTIDSTPLANNPWESYKLYYQGDKPSHAIPLWMDAKYEIWF